MSQAKAPTKRKRQNILITQKIIITQPPRIKLIKPTQNPLLQMSLLRSDKYAHNALSRCNCHSVAHAFPPAASGPHLPLLLALLAAQHPSHPVATRHLVDLVSLLAVDVFYWLFGVCLTLHLPATTIKAGLRSGNSNSNGP